MNIERINALADLIEKQQHNTGNNPEGHAFKMTAFEYSCGTPACICGWTNSTAGRKDLDDYEYAGKWLGLEEDEESELFFPHKEWATITPASAARTLRHLAKTGDVVWEFEDGEEGE